MISKWVVVGSLFISSYATALTVDQEVKNFADSLFPNFSGNAITQLPHHSHLHAEFFSTFDRAGISSGHRLRLLNLAYQLFNRVDTPETSIEIKFYLQLSQRLLKSAEFAMHYPITDKNLLEEGVIAGEIQKIISNVVTFHSPRLRYLQPIIELWKRAEVASPIDSEIRDIMSHNNLGALNNGQYMQTLAVWPTSLKLWSDYHSQRFCLRFFR